MQMAELPQNWDGDSTQLEILLEKVANAVNKMTSFSGTDENQQALTPASEVCPPTYLKDVMALKTKALKEIDSSGSRPVPSLQSATYAKEPGLLVSTALQVTLVFSQKLP